jgi:hypothetical protein
MKRLSGDYAGQAPSPWVLREAIARAEDCISRVAQQGLAIPDASKEIEVCVAATRYIHGRNRLLAMLCMAVCLGPIVPP